MRIKPMEGLPVESNAPISLWLLEHLFSLPSIGIDPQLIREESPPLFLSSLTNDLLSQYLQPSGLLSDR
jgi:hypothetical protein